MEKLEQKTIFEALRFFVPLKNITGTYDLLFSIESWLLHRDPYFMVYYNHQLGSTSSPTNHSKQPG